MGMDSENLNLFGIRKLAQVMSFEWNWIKAWPGLPFAPFATWFSANNSWLNIASDSKAIIISIQIAKTGVTLPDLTTPLTYLHIFTADELSPFGLSALSTRRFGLLQLRSRQRSNICHIPSILCQEDNGRVWTLAGCVPIETSALRLGLGAGSMLTAGFWSFSYP